MAHPLYILFAVCVFSSQSMCVEHVLAGGAGVGGGHFRIRMVVRETGICHFKDAESRSGMFCIH